jgi:ABC-2 type transport system ATP-binding protein
MLHDPELLILDEPTNGLDPNGIVETRELIKKLNRERGVTILVSSHILAEVERMATHVGIIHKGKLLFQGSLTQLQNMKSRQSFIQIDTMDNEATLKLLSNYGAELKNGYVQLPFKERAFTAAINRKLVEQNIDVYLLQQQQSDLEQLFIEITSNTSQ